MGTYINCIGMAANEKRMEMAMRRKRMKNIKRWWVYVNRRVYSTPLPLTFPAQLIS